MRKGKTSRAKKGFFFEFSCYLYQKLELARGFFDKERANGGWLHKVHDLLAAD